MERRHSEVNETFTSKLKPKRQMNGKVWEKPMFCSDEILESDDEYADDDASGQFHPF